MKQSKLKVLLVEDDLICQQAEKEILAKHHCEVETAKTAREALELINHLHVDVLAKQYDFIFMDIGLPDINGDYVTEMIRKTEEWVKPIPIIAVTGHGSPQDKERFLKKGISYVIVKPLTSQKLACLFKKF